MRFANVTSPAAGGRKKTVHKLKSPKKAVFDKKTKKYVFEIFRRAKGLTYVKTKKVGQ